MTSLAHAGVLFVDATAPPGGSGQSWATAFNNLQGALVVAPQGGEIRVAQGLYKPAAPNAPRESTFSLRSGVTLKGGYVGVRGPDPDARPYTTALDADLNAVLSQSGPLGSLTGDVNDDGAVTFADLNLILSNFAHNCQPSAHPV